MVFDECLSNLSFHMDTRWTALACISNPYGGIGETLESSTRRVSRSFKQMVVDASLYRD